MGFWFGKRTPAVQISENAQLNIVGYLQKYHKDIEAYTDPATKIVAEEIRRAYVELFLNINKTQPAILVLKKIRKTIEMDVDNRIRSGQVDTVGSSLADKVYIEDLLSQLGVTNFEP